RLSFPGFDEEKFHRRFLSFSPDANFLRARQFFVTSESLQSITKCPAANTGDCHRVAALESQFRAQLQPKTGICTHFSNAPPQPEEFSRRDIDFLRHEKTRRQSRSPE